MKKLNILSFLLLLALLPQAARAEYYGIKVGGVSVTSDNCDNITGSNIWSYGYSRTKEFVPEASHVSYDPSTKTLTLKYIQIERTGSGNRAILNESCDGLTIVFEDTNYLSALAASPIRLNANTTIKCASGRYGDIQKIQGSTEDAITVAGGATLLIEDVSMDVSSSDKSDAFVGNTGTERLIIKDAAVWAQGMHGVKDFAMLGVQNGHLWLKGDNAAAKNLKDFSMVGKTMYLTDTFYNDGTLNFLNSSDYSVAREITIADYIEINETNFPDDTFRSYVSEEFDKDNDGRLTYQGEANSNYFNNIIDVSNKGLTSLKGIEHFPYLETLKCANNNLTSLDVSKLPRLRNLDCHSNQLTSLNVIKEKRYNWLLKLNCSQNKLTRLDISQGIGDELDCSSNQLTYIDFSHCNDFLHKINISRNRIDAMMTETMESLPTVIKGAWNKDIEYTITVCFSTSNDNVCTGAQADIARNKGWDVYVAGLDDDGNVVYDIEIGGTMVTSANADDLTVLPNVTKNCDDGYAYFNPTKQTLCLSGVDIVNANGIGINLDCKNEHRIIELGQDPVNIFSKDDGIYYYDHFSGGSLTITTKEDYWFSEKLNIVSTDGMAINLETGNLTLSGVARVVAKSGAPKYDIRIANRTLYVKDDAELRIKANVDETVYPLYADNLVLENDNIIVAPAGAHFENKYLKSAEGTYIKGQEVVIGKLREYNYYVAGTRISNANQHAVLGDTTVVFQEPAFNGGAGTLVLNNANIEAGSEAGINAGNALYIKLEGENTINSSTYGIATKYCDIQGPGSLYVKGQYGIDAHLSKLFISDDAKVTAEGTTRYAIDGKETTISGEGTIVRMKCGPDARGTFRASTSLTLGDGIIIDEPEGAQYVDGEIKDADGNVIKDQWVTLQYTERYEVYVAGTQVTNHNMADVLEDGTVSYNPETQTLTLNEAYIDGGLGNCIEANQELHINLVGYNTLETDLSLGATGIGIAFNTNTGYIEGTGELAINAPYGIDAKGNALNILGGAKVTSCALQHGIRSGITTISGEETVVRTKGDQASFACMGLTLNDGLEITEPAGASFNLSRLAICAGRRNTIVAGQWVTIKKVKLYDLHVAGTQVTDINKDDVLGDGTVSYDSETESLTLNGANINAQNAEGIQSSINLTIRLVGKNTIVAENYYGIWGPNASIEGPGSLSCKGSQGIYIDSRLYICDNAIIHAEGDTYGICVRNMTVSGSGTVVMMKGGRTAYAGLNPTLEDDLFIAQPEGVYFDVNKLVGPDGKAIANEWLVICSQDYIDGINDLKDSKDLNDSTYNLAGQKVGSGYKGIVVEGGRKVLKK